MLQNDKKVRIQLDFPALFTQGAICVSCDRSGPWERVRQNENKMAEVKLKNLLRLYKLRDKFDAVILALHACLVERGFRCINSGEEVSTHLAEYDLQTNEFL